MNIHSGQIPVEAMSELSQLLQELRITDRFADSRYGDYWSVYGHPSPAEEESHFDILLNIRPRSPYAGYKAGGLLIMLQSNEDFFWLSGDLTNKRGQAWFKNLPLGCYHVVADRKQLISLGQMVRKAAAAELPVTDLCVFHFEDGRARAYLERSANTGKATLTVSTEAPELQNAMVCFTIGEESGKIVLTPTEIPTLCEGSYRLNQTFKEAMTCVPQFKVLPVHEDQKE